MKTYSITSSYDDYEGDVPRDEYIKILKKAFWWMSRLSIINRKDVNLPFLGKVGPKKVYKRKNEGRLLDYGHYKKTGEKKFYSNMHTSGDVFSWRWLRKTSKLKYKKFYKFGAARGNEDFKIGKKGLSRYIVECSEDPYKKDYEVNEY